MKLASLAFCISSFHSDMASARDHFVYAPGQWEMTLQCKVGSHWLGTCTEWLLYHWWLTYTYLQNGTLTHCGLGTSYDDIPSGPALAQVMACCLMASSRCLNKCWLIINKVLWHSSESNFTRMPKLLFCITFNDLKIISLNYRHISQCPWYKAISFFIYACGPFSLTWFNFNPSMDK